MSQHPVSRAREGALREGMRRVEDLLKRNRAGELGDDVIEELVSLSWIEWQGGALRLTLTGANICRQVPAPS
ncbi:MAG: hypothetical protein J0H69_01420 [Burkholderiales bacterium]|jgi:hypothetical protein|nr:hypothetical protein [Burkholderiales bacterium]